MSTKINRLQSFPLLGQASMGALIGFLMALIVAGSLFDVGGRLQEMPSDLLSWNLHNLWHKPREKGFYLFSLLFSTAGAYFTTRRRWFTPYQVVWGFLAISIPVMTSLAQHVLQDNDCFYYLYSTTACSMLFIFIANRKSEDISIHSLPKYNSDIFNWKIYLIF